MRTYQYRYGNLTVTGVSSVWTNRCPREEQDEAKACREGESEQGEEKKTKSMHAVSLLFLRAYIARSDVSKENLRKKIKLFSSYRIQWHSTLCSWFCNQIFELETSETYWRQDAEKENRPPPSLSPPGWWSHLVRNRTNEKIESTR